MKDREDNGAVPMEKGHVIGRTMQRRKVKGFALYLGTSPL